MQISLKWTSELINLKTIKLHTLIEKLTLGGFEVEEILELETNKQKQFVLEISATANRSDSLSIQGLSREISVLANLPIKTSNYLKNTRNWTNSLTNFYEPNLADNNCSIFISLIVNHLNNTTVPRWITEKLSSSGQILFNNFVDFKNYILLETGYPFEFYDLNNLCLELNNPEFRLSISEADLNQKFYASNDEQYNLNNSILVVKANDIPISIAGIIESKKFSYSNTTNSLLIEGSIFNSAKIRQQSRNLGVRTNRSARYEKSLKTTYILESLYRLISLLRISNPNLTCKLHTFITKKEPIPKPVLLKYKTINEILGPIHADIEKNLSYLTPDRIESYLKRLNFQFSRTEPEFAWEVQIPHSRADDLTREIDLIEEIGRLHGFNNFLTTLPKVKMIGNGDSNYKLSKKLTTCFLNFGFNELVHYSLVNKETFLFNEIKLVNPFLTDCSNLRSSLLPGLLKTVQENEKQGSLIIEGFEYGHVFFENLTEKEYVAGIFGGVKTKLTWFGQETTLTWFESKGKIEKLFKQLNLPVVWQNCALNYVTKILHPYRSAQIYSQNNVSLGIFGQIHPSLANKLNISSNIYLFEFDLHGIQNQIQTNNVTVSKDYSSYPKIIKDLSIIIGKEITFNNLKEILYCNGTEFLTEVNLLDEYKGQSIPKEHTSLCLQLVFQSSYRTLQNKEIDNIINKLQSVLHQKFGGIIRE